MKHRRIGRVERARRGAQAWLAGRSLPRVSWPRVSWSRLSWPRVSWGWLRARPWIAAAGVVGLAGIAGTAGLVSYRGEQPPLAGTAAARDGELSICVRQPRPMYAQPAADGRLTGLDADLLTDLARRVKLTPRFVTVPAHLVNTGQGFSGGLCEVMAGGLAITPERSVAMDFVPDYLSTSDAVLVRAGKAAKTMRDKTVAIEAGESDRTTLVARVKSLGAKVAQRPDIDAALRDLDAGTVDGIAGDSVGLAYLARTSRGRYQVAVEPGGSERIGFGVEKGSPKVRKGLVKALRAAQRDGSYRRTYQRWLAKTP